MKNSILDRNTPSLEVDSRFRRSPHSLKNHIARQVWAVVYLTLFRTSPRLLHGWRRFLLRLFGAKVGADVKLFPSTRIWAPWNLELGDNCSLGDAVDCYCVTKVKVGSCATISQRATLCAATHDISSLVLPLVAKEISIGSYAWLCAETFVMPGVSIGDGTVVGVRSTVFKDLPPWQVAFGTPCKVVARRVVSPDGAVCRDNDLQMGE